MRHLVTLVLVAWVFDCSCAGAAARVSHQLVRDDSQLKIKGVRDVFGRGLNGVVKKRSSQGVEIDASDVDGNMPLMRVVLGNKKAAASALLAGDADANVKNLEQDSAVWLTDREDAGDIVKLFAQHDSAADAQNNEGVSTILVASKGGFYHVETSLISLDTNMQLAERLQAVKIPVSHGRELNDRDLLAGSTPFHMMANGCQSGVSLWLLNKRDDKGLNINTARAFICLEDLGQVAPENVNVQHRSLQEILINIAGMRNLKGREGSGDTSASGVAHTNTENEIADTSEPADALLSPDGGPRARSVNVNEPEDTEELGRQGGASSPENDCFFDDCAPKPTEKLRSDDNPSTSKGVNDEDLDAQMGTTLADDGCFFDDCSSASSGASGSEETPDAKSIGSVNLPEEDCFFDNCAPAAGSAANDGSGTHVTSSLQEGSCLSPPCEPNKSINEVNDSQSSLDVITVDPKDLIHSPPSSNRVVIVVTVASIIGLLILGIIIYLFGVRKLAKMPSEEELVARLDAGNWPDSNGVVKADVEVVSNLPKELGRSEMHRLANTPLAVLPEDPPSEENGRHPSPVPPLHIKDMKQQQKKAKSDKEREIGHHSTMVVEHPRQPGGGAHGGKRVAFADVTSTGNSVVDPPSGSVDLNSRQALMDLYHDNHYGDAHQLGEINYETYTEDSVGSLDPQDPVSESSTNAARRSRHYKGAEHLTKSENPLYKSNQHSLVYVDSLTGRSDESRDYQNDRRISLTGSF